jgi:opacity protein-like surface antigen
VEALKDGPVEIVASVDGVSGSTRLMIDSREAISLALLLDFGDRQWLSLRADLGAVGYQPVNDRVCLFSELAGCSGSYSVTTTRSTYYLSVGPQLSPFSGVFRPYAHAGVGGSLFLSSSPNQGGWQGNELRTMGLDWTGGTGVALDLFGNMGAQLTLDAGARYRGGTRANYAPRGRLERDDTRTMSFVHSPGPRDVILFSAGLRLAF